MRNHLILFFIVLFTSAIAQENEAWKGKFEPLDQTLPTPNVYRTGDGSPGPEYWQQRADYIIDVTLHEAEQKISGTGRIKYYNNSPQTLYYLWLQLDQNRRTPHSEEKKTARFNLPDTIPGGIYKYYMKERSSEGGIHITTLKDKSGNELPYHIEKTMLRIDLPEPLKPGDSYEFATSWWYNLNNRMEDRGRSGMEYFPEDDNYVYTIAQFYPRMAVYDDFEGWQHKQFLGGGEFALTFGNFEVTIHTSDDHLLMATGELKNAKEVLNPIQYKRYKQAQNSFDAPIIIATQEEAIAREQQKSTQLKTWKFKAENVRDFAFATSRKFIWDAQAVKLAGKTVLAQSLYPKEGNPLWEKESTKAVINTLKTYSKYSIDYPYPQATSVHAAAIGMEYPMICFNFGRPDKDGFYSEGTRFNMLGVIIHEVGHNFFPMIVNSDERQWGWMDEGINSFLEYLTEQECYENFPSSRGSAESIVDYMASGQQYMRPIMTTADNIYSLNLGNNAYGKPASALNILRETILGRENFDHAFKTYAQKWAFKHPKPADFFRTMEDAAGIDLDWFWKGWFYTIDAVDIAIDTVTWYQIEPKPSLAQSTNPTTQSGPNADLSISDVSTAQRLVIADTPDGFYWEFLDRWDEDQIRAELLDKHIYKVRFSNKGGLVMPIIVEFEFESGEKQREYIPAEIWRINEYTVHKVFVLDQKVKSIILDPDLETADINKANGKYPRVKEQSRFGQFKDSQE